MDVDVLGTFAEEFSRCWICGITPLYDLHIHHIVRGVNRSRARSERCALIRTCARCHNTLDGMPIVTQLAIKAIHDFDHLDIVKVNALRRRQPGAITESEVFREVCQIAQRAGYTPLG